MKALTFKSGRVVVICTRNGTRTFRCLPGATAHRTADGRDINLWEWEGHCVVCGAPFAVSATFCKYDPAQDIGRSGGPFSVVTCPDHRRQSGPKSIAKR